MPSSTTRHSLFDLISAIDLHDFGDVDMTVEEVRDDLAGADLANDSWLVYRPEAEGAALVAFAAVEPRADEEFRGQVSVHPEWRRRGIGSALARQLEQAVRERLTPDATEPIPILGFVKGDSTPERQWARAWATPGRAASGGCGSTSVSAAGAGVAGGHHGPRLRASQDERAMYDTQEAAFADHWGHVPRPYEDFVKRLERSDFDPSLWHMALDGDTVVGAASNSTLPDGVGGSAGLAPSPAIGGGIARALLLHSFGVFWRRGFMAWRWAWTPTA